MNSHLLVGIYALLKLFQAYSKRFQYLSKCALLLLAQALALLEQSLVGNVAEGPLHHILYVTLLFKLLSQRSYFLLPRFKLSEQGLTFVTLTFHFRAQMVDGILHMAQISDKCVGDAGRCAQSLGYKNPKGSSTDREAKDEGNSYG